MMVIVRTNLCCPVKSLLEITVLCTIYMNSVMLFLSLLCKIKLVLVLCGRVNYKPSEIEKENYANQKEEELKEGKGIRGERCRREDGDK